MRSCKYSPAQPIKNRGTWLADIVEKQVQLKCMWGCLSGNRTKVKIQPFELLIRVSRTNEGTKTSNYTV